MPRPMVGASDKIRISRVACADEVAGAVAFTEFSGRAATLAGKAAVAQILPQQWRLAISAMPLYPSPLSDIGRHAPLCRGIHSFVCVANARREWPHERGHNEDEEYSWR